VCLISWLQDKTRGPFRLESQLRENQPSWTSSFSLQATGEKQPWRKQTVEGTNTMDTE